MKKRTLPLILFLSLITAVFVSCSGGAGAPADTDGSAAGKPSEADRSGTESGGVSSSEPPVSNAEACDEKIEGLLSAAAEEKAELLKQIEELEIKIEAQRTKRVYIKDGIYLLLKFRPESIIFYNSVDVVDVSIAYKNDEPPINLSISGIISSIEISPDRSKIIMNEGFEFESPGKVILYDVDKKEKNGNAMPVLPVNYTPALLKWLDDRYFLAIVQLAQGTIVRGGDVYVYDTETDNYKMLISGNDYKFQTCYFDIYGDNFVLFTSIIYEESLNYYETVYHILTFEEIYNAINDDKIIILN